MLPEGGAAEGEATRDPPAAPASNLAVVEGNLLAPVQFRVTASGRPVVFLELEHVSRHPDPDSAMRLEMRLPVMVLGEAAERCRHLAPGTPLRVTGRLNQKRWLRDGKIRWGQMELAAIRVETLTDAGGADTGSH